MAGFRFETIGKDNFVASSKVRGISAGLDFLPLMKPLLSLAIVFFTGVAALAQKPNVELPETVKAAAAPLLANFPKVEAKKSVKAPADSVWIFRARRRRSGRWKWGFRGRTWCI